MIGIDEVGRGCWAGPLLVVSAKAVHSLPAGLADSKSLTAIKREKLYEQIISSCRIGEGWVSSDEIDELGLAGAMRLGVNRSLTQLEAGYNDPIIFDGNINYCLPEFNHVRCIIKADMTHPIVSAASIYAKVTRDQHMKKLSASFPGYGFENNVGYGTKLHIQALKKNGITKIHRKSYKPIKAFL
jgi:ribonuclease HII